MSIPPSPAGRRDVPPLRERLKEIFAVYFKFGYIAFGGPNAHIAILYDEVVVKRQWISIDQFAELVAISQALPGPASAKVAIPGAIIMTVAGALIGGIKGDIPLWATRLEQGLASAAIGIVALAGYRMSTTLATDKMTRTVALLAGSVSALYTAPWLLPTVMVLGGVVSYISDVYLAPFLSNWKAKRKAKSDVMAAAQYDLEQGIVGSRSRPSNHAGSNSLDPGQSPTFLPSNIGNELQNGPQSVARDSGVDDQHGDRLSAESIESRHPITKTSHDERAFTYSRKSGLLCFLIFLGLLVASILVRVLATTSKTADYAQLVSTFYFVGSIIFGGGNVVVPLLKSYTVDVGWMTDQQFLVGLALVQSLPVPFWQYFRDRPSVRMVFRGVNACALGFVFSASWLLWKQTTVIGGSNDFHAVIVTTAFVASGYLGVPVPLVIIFGGAMGVIEYAVSTLS
ncbi:hypothetical protein BGZ91_002619 [Linnemannia elongata]|nr:hypothetical protein BGZ91_002619 [Linnemannia elongata]KAG0062114.1 hypothetical protein BGZ90_003250 [Linnemannia elongata]